MYWNTINRTSHSLSLGLIETWDVLKSVMSCDGSFSEIGLIETWDVLKSLTQSVPYNFVMINRNMRCIEMWIHIFQHFSWFRINRNMRCIEILLNILLRQKIFRLIETWDVLKWSPDNEQVITSAINRNMRCIEIRIPPFTMSLAVD